MSEGLLNPQYGNMGNLGDILKHGALVELAAIARQRMGYRPSFKRRICGTGIRHANFGEV